MDDKKLLIATKGKIEAFATDPDGDSFYLSFYETQVQDFLIHIKYEQAEKLRNILNVVLESR